MNKYELTVGLEVHIILNTRSKVFCSCKNDLNSTPNENVCEICLGMPGALPKLNEEVVKKSLMLGEILNCEVNDESEFDRKHFESPDLVKNFQITQFRKPILGEGYLDIIKNKKIENKKRIYIERVHIEEDAGKQIKKEGKILIDYNRSGSPLLEIVTKPCFNSAEEVRAFLEQLQMIIKYNDISECKMNEGAFRFDVNVSIKEKGSKQLGNRCEFKNLNSFGECERAIAEEFKRQVKLKEKNEEIKTVTLNWDEKNKKIEILRPKENIYEYEYLIESNLPLLEISHIKVKEISILEDKITELKEKYNLSYEESLLLIKNKEIEKYFKYVVGKVGLDKEVYNFIKEEVIKSEKNNMISKENLTELFKQLKKGSINYTLMKKVQSKIEEHKNLLGPIEIMEMYNIKLLPINEIEKIIENTIASNENIVIDYKNGKEKALESLTGKIMKISNGLADPTVTKVILKEKLK